MNALSSMPRDVARGLHVPPSRINHVPSRELLLPAMITRRALHADGARLLSAAATSRAARVGGDAYTPSPAIFALAQEHREAIMKETTSGQPELVT